eukprot:96681-Pelagomonas_calceolata.AAC.1
MAALCKKKAPGSRAQCAHSKLLGTLLRCRTIKLQAHVLIQGYKHTAAQQNVTQRAHLELQACHRVGPAASIAKSGPCVCPACIG